jgi:glycosyltransferase involved in cell wall biosynthesis
MSNVVAEVDACPLVSVILAVHNRAGSVGRAISSVLAQDYAPIELIVVDDGSTDGTRAAVEAFGERVTLLRQPHAGAYVARNHALRHARGELVAFIDSDDAWLPGKIAAQVPLMRRPQVGLVFGDTIHIAAPRDDAAPTGMTSFRASPAQRGDVLRSLMWSNFVPTTTVLVRRACLVEIGGFSETSRISADYLAWFRIARTHQFDFVEAPVARYTVHAEGISYDLGRSLVARIGLFTDELAAEPDPKTRKVLRRLLVNLSLHLALASIRGRAATVAEPLKLAWRTGLSAGGVQAPAWTAGFAARQIRMRLGRLFS